MSASFLVVGDSKGGKTTTVLRAALAGGYEVFGADFDKAMSYVRPYLSDEENKRLHIVPLGDHIVFRDASMAVFDMKAKQTVQKKVTLPDIKGYSAIDKFLSLLDNFKADGQDFGSPFNWGPEKMFIIDSGTEMGDAIIRHIQREMGRGGYPMRIGDWAGPQNMEVNILSDLISASCTFCALYHLKSLHPKRVVPDDVDAVINYFEDLDDPKAKEALVTAVSKGLWPTAIGEKNAKTGVPKLFSIYLRIYREEGEDMPKLQFRANKEVNLALPLPEAEKKLIEKLPAEEGLKRIFNRFSPIGG